MIIGKRMKGIDNKKQALLKEIEKIEEKWIYLQVKRDKKGLTLDEEYEAESLSMTLDELNDEYQNL